MWKKGHMSAEHVRRGKNFDLIIEPSDIAETAGSESIDSPSFDKVVTDPIWLLGAGRDPAARRGAGKAEFSLRSAVLPHSARVRHQPRCCFVVRRDYPELAPTGHRALHRRVADGERHSPNLAERELPSAFSDLPLFASVRFSISAAGYNSFHELIGFEVPRIFIANNHHMMDDQSARAEFAMRTMRRSGLRKIRREH